MELATRGGRGERGPAARVRIGLAGILALVCALATTGPWSDKAEAEARYTSEKSKVTRGLYLVRKYDNKLDTRIKVLKINTSTALTIDVALSNEELPGRERTTSMAARHDAIAAINASFGTSWGRPIGVFAEDGSLKASPLVAGGAFSLSRDESVAHVGYPRFTVRAHPLGTQSKALWISDWNDQFANPDKISGYTGAGGNVVKPPDNACSAKLKGKSKVRWARGNAGVSRTYRVLKVGCRQRPFTVGAGVVLSAPQGSVGATKLTERLKRDDKVNLTWSVGWTGALDVVGGSPVLVMDGEIIAQPCGGYVCHKHPRTGVGVTNNGTILLVTVDGRQADSKGLTIEEFARLLKKLGAVRALNLDGGGSSTMVVKGEIVNSPSSGSERAVASSLLVLKHPDNEEPEPGAPLGSAH